MRLGVDGLVELSAGALHGLLLLLLTAKDVGVGVLLVGHVVLCGDAGVAARVRAGGARRAGCSPSESGRAGCPR